MHDDLGEPVLLPLLPPPLQPPLPLFLPSSLYLSYTSTTTIKNKSVNDNNSTLVLASISPLLKFSRMLAAFEIRIAWREKQRSPLIQIGMYSYIIYCLARYIRERHLNLMERDTERAMISRK